MLYFPVVVRFFGCCFFCVNVGHSSLRYSERPFLIRIPFTANRSAGDEKPRTTEQAVKGRKGENPKRNFPGGLMELKGTLLATLETSETCTECDVPLHQVIKRSPGTKSFPAG